MSTAQTKKTPKPPTPPTRKPAQQPGRTPPTGWIIGGVIAVIVVIAGIIAITSSGGDDGDATPVAPATDGGTANTSTGSTAPAGEAGPGSAIAETRPVVVTGTPLVRLGDGADAAIGQQAPTIAGASFDGSPLTIGPGNPTLVVFLAHWCPHCRAEVPRLVEWNESGLVPEGLDVIGVATGTREQAENYPPSEWLAEEGWPFPVMADDDAQSAATALGISVYPFFVLLDAEGKVAARDGGEIEPEELTALIEAALGA